jgi:hypothetical protein
MMDRLFINVSFIVFSMLVHGCSSERAAYELLDNSQSALLPADDGNSTGSDDLIRKDGDAGSDDSSKGEIPKQKVPEDDSADDDKDFDDKKPEEKVKILCNTHPNLTLKQDFKFEPPGKVCKWGIGQNLSILNNFIRARRDQFLKLNIDPNAVVCDMTFTIPEQEMKFDDEVFFLFGDVILASSIDYNDFFESKEELNFFDFTKIINAPYAWPDAYYCLGAKDGKGKCQIPFTQTLGKMELAYDPSLIRRVALENGFKFGTAKASSLNLTSATTKDMDEGVEPVDGHGFRFVTLGDNDKTDCQHTGFSFSVDVKYIFTE